MATTTNTNTIADSVIEAYWAAVSARLAESNTDEFVNMLQDSFIGVPFDENGAPIANSIIICMDQSAQSMRVNGCMAVELATEAMDIADPARRIIRVVNETWERIYEGTYVVRW